MAGFLLLATPAHAYDLELDSETIGQSYQVAGAGSLLSRQRLDQYLGLHVWNLGPKDATGAPLAKNQLYFTMSLRFEHDFGDYPPAQDKIERQLYGSRDVTPELGNNRFDLLYAYLGARDVFGLLDLRLGRQLEVDLFDYVSFDGLAVEAKTPFYVAAEAYAGLQVNGALGAAVGLPFDSLVYRPDGTAASALSPHETDFRPTLGVSVRSFGFRDLDARFSYRETWSPAQHTSADENALNAGSGVVEQKIGWSARGRLLDGRLIPWAGLRYDLLVGVVDVIQAGARFTITERHSLQLEYLYSFPTFDGDSIWNLFVRREFNDVRLGYDLRAGRARGWARGFVRLFNDEPEAKDRLGGTAPVLASDGSRLDWGGNLGARWDFGPGYVRADGYLELGYGGTRSGVDLATRFLLWHDISVDGRITYAHFQDDLRVDAKNQVLPAVDSVGIQAGVRMQLGRGILLHVIVEDNVNRFYTSQFRFYGILDLAFLLGPRGFSAGYPTGIGPGLGQFTNPLGTGRGF